MTIGSAPELITPKRKQYYEKENVVVYTLYIESAQHQQSRRKWQARDVYGRKREPGQEIVHQAH